jgi:hypothetical protein
MIVAADNFFTQSLAPHSMGLRNDMTIPMPGWDANPNLTRSTRLWAAPSLQKGWPCCSGRVGPKGLAGLTFDGTGFLGTGLFSGDPSTWGLSEIIASMVGMYAIYSMYHQAGQTKYRLEGAAHKRRKTKAQKLREKAKQLEAKELGGIFA